MAHYLENPVKCHLWQKNNLILEDLNKEVVFELLNIFVDDSHNVRKLLKCKQCEQLYFYEFYEEIDWQNSNDRQYHTFIPVASQVLVNRMSKMTSLDLLQYMPRLQYEFIDDNSQSSVSWIGRNQ